MFSPEMRLILLLMAATMFPLHTLAAPQNDRHIDELIDALGDTNPQQRARAADELAALGEAARPALIRASRGSNPAIANAAARILIALPWTGSDDPQAVRIALQNYGKPDPAERAAIATEIARRYPRPIANTILLRLLLEDPSDDVCWQAGALLRRQLDPQTARQLLDLKPANATAPLLTLRGRLLLNHDPAGALQLFRTAIDLEEARQTNDEGELAIAFDALCGDAILDQRYADALALRRSQLMRSAYSSEGLPAAREVLALHVRHGPLDGFEHDLRQVAASRNAPELLYCAALACSRGGDMWLAQPALTIAPRVSVTSAARLNIARSLVSLDEPQLAERELRVMLSNEAREHDINQINAQMMLASLAAARGDDAAAAEQLVGLHELLARPGLKLHRTTPDGRAVEFEPAELQYELEWRRFRAARGDADQAGMNRHLRALLAGRLTSTTIALDLIDHLETEGRTADAERAFEKAAAVLRQRLRQSPGDPSLMNQLAWLCARSNRRLDEALQLAEQAIQTAPGHAAFIDTAAEANFRCGNVERAVLLAQVAVTLEPYHAFMREQLARFRQAERKPITAPAAPAATSPTD